jgi:hypothetical protein
VIRVSNADYLDRPLRLDSSEASALIVALRLSDSDRQFLRSFWAALRRRTGVATKRGA